MNRHLIDIRVAVIAVLLVTLSIGAAVSAKNVDFSTVPIRNTVQLTIYNSEDLTLVRETRTVSFKKGSNTLQFSWANTLIDPSSVELNFVTHRDKLDLLDTTFPHDRSQLLVWHVNSNVDGEVEIEITYFTSGISWSAAYVCVADAAEETMSVESQVLVTNNSGEQYKNAQVRLIVGQINLVEKIAQLSKVPLGDAELLKNRRGQAYYLGAKLALNKPAADAPSDSDDSNGAIDESLAPKRVIKEGLSEYFIYTIEGTETIPNGWSKRLRSFRQPSVPCKIEYRYRISEYGNQLVRMYLLKNDKESTLGDTPLPNGMVRVFRRNGHGGLSYLTAQQIKYVPIGDKIELNLGVDPRVVFQWTKLRSWRTHIWLRPGGARALRRLDDGALKMEVDGTVVGWDEHGYYAQRIRNYGDKPIQIAIRRIFPGHVVFRNALGAAKHDYQTVEFHTTVAASKTADLRCEVVTHMGRNKKQDNVKLVDVREH